MRPLRKFLESQERHFAKGGKLERLYPLFEAAETLAFTPASVTRGTVHVRDALDLKRMMIVVVVALLPTVVKAVLGSSGTWPRRYCSQQRARWSGEGM